MLRARARAGRAVNPANWLLRAARQNPQSPALYEGTRLEATYQQWKQRAASLATALQEQGVVAGDRVVICMKNHTRYLELLYAVWYLGAVIVPVNAKLHPREVAWVVADCGARVLLCSEVFRAGLEAEVGADCRVLGADTEVLSELYQRPEFPAPLTVSGDDLLWIFYTSGTTGKPKGVMLSSANIQAMCGSYHTDVDAVSAQDAMLYAAPLSHGAGLYHFMHVLSGARHVVPASGGFEAREIFELAELIGSVSMFAAPTMVRRLVDHAKSADVQGAGIKTIVYGGGPMYRADIEDAVTQLGPKLVQIYGLGECPMAITSLNRALVADREHPRWRERLASVGMAQSSAEVRIVDAEGVPLGCGETGEIIVTGAAVMSGYWNNAAATAATLRDGWLWTGDMGRLDEDGFLTLQDRSKDVIISGGSNIYPREVEEVLLMHPAVHEVSVVGRASREWGEELVAFVVLGEGHAACSDALDAFCLEHIARFKRPKAYFYEGELPKSNYGKVLKTVLRKRLAEA